MAIISKVYEKEVIKWENYYDLYSYLEKVGEKVTEFEFYPGGKFSVEQIVFHYNTSTICFRGEWPIILDENKFVFKIEGNAIAISCELKISSDTETKTTEVFNELEKILLRKN